ncbi:myrosinase 1-like [Culicoides brevitarsis]|uniref:myrosinase 1-like n=1 Tax=Culicoides brevitarsis TaxID=469753 RepID=UPI00307C1514
MTHNQTDKITDKSNGDITSDSYHNWRRDIEMVRELGVSIYRFSLSWPRILPSGFPSTINKQGIRYYNNLIDGLLRYNITPMVTLYHWDLPRRLQELGGWTNEQLIGYFKDYARICFENFGNRVKIWTTFNEPWHICEQAYGMDVMAPAYNYPGIPSYLCGHTLLKAHAEVVHMYREVYLPKHRGRIGITLDTSWMEPISSSDEDRETSNMAMQFYLGWFAHPIYKGDYPPVMKNRIAELSRQQGFTKSRLPEFTEAEAARILNTSDFFGINSYTSVLVTKNVNNVGNFPVPSFQHDMDAIETHDQNWPTSGSAWLRVFPRGMYNLLQWIRREYDNPTVIVTESGVSDKGGTNDTARISYYNSYLEAVLDAIEEGCNIEGYIAWSLMDSFEWTSGFTEKFGLYYVDFNDPKRTRYAKASARAFERIAKTNMIDRDYKPHPEIHIPAPSVSNSAVAFGAKSFIRTSIIAISMSYLITKLF